MFLSILQKCIFWHHTFAVPLNMYLCYYHDSRETCCHKDNRKTCKLNLILPIKGNGEMMMERQKNIIRTSVLGIVVNVALALTKYIIGIASHSVAITSDAINNLSDALSSIITIVGAVLSNKEPNKKHPFGYGRIEYVSGIVVSFLVLYAGVTMLIESIKNIITPQIPSYTSLSILILCIAIVVKLALGIYTKKKGKAVVSEALIASGKDSMNDSIISLSVVFSAIIFIVFKVNINAYVGILISALIIKSGVELVGNSLNDILGKRTNRSLSKKVKELINENPQVHGTYDLFLDDYGPNKYMGSVHIEIDDTMTAAEIDSLSRKIQKDIFEKFNILLATIGIYAFNTTDKEAVEIYENVKSIVFEHTEIIQFHGFYVETKNKTMSFDIIISFDFIQEQKKIYDEIMQKVSAKYSDYKINIGLDLDISD